MPIVPLTRDDLDRLAMDPVIVEYAAFLGSRQIGDGGRLRPAEEGVSRTKIKNRLKTAAELAGVRIDFVPSPDDEVVFEVVDARHPPKRRGRPPKSAS